MNLGHQEESKKKEAEQVCEGFERMKAERSTWESHWQEVMDYVVPRKGNVTRSGNAGEKRGAELFDTTAIMANQLLGGALHGMLTSPSIKFFDLVFGDPALDDDDEVKEWLQDTGDRMFSVLQNSNFQTEIHEIYIDLGSIGTAGLFMGEHERDIIHFGARPIKELFIDENNLGAIDKVCREFAWKPRQIVQEFGEKNVPEKLVEEAHKGNDEPLTIVHEVCPEMDTESGRSQVFPIRSRYVLKEQKYLLHRGGFKEFPYAVPRWTKIAGEKYGRGPGMEMLPDIKMVNKMMEATLKGAQKTVDPPLMVADDGVIGRVRLTPGGLTVVRPSSDVPIRPLIVDARIDFGYQAVEDVRRRIRAGFYVDQLQLNEGPQMTATEVMQRTEEKLRLMGPVLGRQHNEFLRPVIDRLFGIMWRRKMIAPPPKKVAGRKLDVRYSSLVARAQRMSEAQNIARALSLIAPMIQIKPETQDTMNFDRMAKHVLDVYGIPPKLSNNAREIEEIREARAQAQEAAIQQQQEAAESENMSKMMSGAAQMQQAMGAQQ